MLEYFLSLWNIRYCSSRGKTFCDFFLTTPPPPPPPPKKNLIIVLVIAALLIVLVNFISFMNKKVEIFPYMCVCMKWACYVWSSHRHSKKISTKSKKLKFNIQCNTFYIIYVFFWLWYLWGSNEEKWMTVYGQFISCHWHHECVHYQWNFVWYCCYTREISLGLPTPI